MASIISKQRRARGLGSAKGGTGHFWVQRVTAVALVPLSLWFMVSLLAVTQSPEPSAVAEWLASPIPAILMLMLIVALFWHAKLGMQVVIEDYVHHEGWKYALLIANAFGCFVGAAVSIVAVLRLHFLDVVSSSI